MAIFAPLFVRHKQQAELLRGLEPVVIMSRGHSGTRVLSWACMHLGVALGADWDLATGDAGDQEFTDRVKKLASRSFGISDPEEVRPRDVRFFQKAVFAYFQGLGSPQGLWGWKFPETYLIGPTVARVFPRAKYLHMMRDGRDIAFKEHLTDNPRRKLGKKILADRQALGLPRYLQAAVSWAYQVDLFDAFRKTLQEDQVLDVSFEGLCSKPEETMVEVCRFLGAEMTEGCRKYLREEINQSKVSQYRENATELVQQVEDTVRETLERYRYV